MISLKEHLWSVTGTAMLVVAVFFFRFFRDTRDRFFLLFGFAFAVFGAHYWALSVWAVPDESRHWLYLVRLLAFALIVGAVIDKNRQNG